MTEQRRARFAGTGYDCPLESRKQEDFLSYYSLFTVGTDRRDTQCFKIENSVHEKSLQRRIFNP